MTSEVFYIESGTHEIGLTWAIPHGWYWQVPGKERVGPFETEEEAIMDAPADTTWKMLHGDYSRCVDCGDGLIVQARYTDTGPLSPLEKADRLDHEVFPKMAVADQLYDAVVAYRKAVHSGIDADPELWADAERKADAALAEVEKRS